MTTQATTTTASSRSRRSSLVLSLIAALLLVSALPFGLAAYQIHLARESLVDQAQRTHLIAARASADRIQTYLSALRGAADSAAQNPQLFEQPASDSAREVLAGLLLSQPNLLAVATFYRADGQDTLVQLARQAGVDNVEPRTLKALTESALLSRRGETFQAGLSRETARPGLRIAVLADARALLDTLEPRELGPSAQLVLMQGDIPHPAFAYDIALPAELLEALGQPQLDALAARTDTDAGVTVSAFARISGSNWSIASLQPAAEAESAAAKMRRGALLAMAAVLLLVAALSALFWRRVVQPVRALLDWQRGMLAGGATPGGDLASLKSAFAQIKKHQRNREALSEVFLGRYKLLSTLGQGAMGSVFLAWDPRLKRHVAIKTIHIETLDARMQKALAKTLENEAVAIANLRHPNIVGVFDLVAAGAFAFVVMEYIEGGNLRTVVSRSGGLSAAEVVLIGRSMLKALQAAHQAGLLHLDIKPANVLVPPDGEIKLTDFGVSTWRMEIPDLVARGGLAGTPGFIAPEYVNGGAPTERSDLYSMGKLLVECLTGHQQNLPGSKPEDLRRAAAITTQLPDALLRQHPALCAALLAMCELDPSRRPADAESALRMLEGLSIAGAEDQLAGRARELSDGIDMGLAGSSDSTAPTVPTAVTTDTTAPPPNAKPTMPTAASESRSDRPARLPASSDGTTQSSVATLPPPIVTADDASGPPDWPTAVDADGADDVESNQQSTGKSDLGAEQQDITRPIRRIEP